LPTAIKQLRGNPGKRALNQDEPQFVARVPACPRWLTGGAREEWRRVARTLADAGVLTEVDRAALLAYCVSYQRWVDAERQVAEKGVVLKTVNGNIIENPYLSVAKRAMRDMLAAMQQFGMTPASRSRVQAATGGEAEMSLAELLFAGVSDDATV